LKARILIDVNSYLHLYLHR